MSCSTTDRLIRYACDAGVAPGVLRSGGRLGLEKQRQLLLIIIEHFTQRPSARKSGP
jgi:hypothetical protein